MRPVTVAIASAGLVAGALLPATQAAASASPGQSRESGRPSSGAAYGAGWLAEQITANGGYLESFGSPDPGNTAYAVLGLHSTGVGKVAGAQAIAYLKTQLTTALHGSDGTDDPGRLGYWIMAAVASGSDPYHFGGHRKVNNLVGRLLATSRTTGADKGLFGAADPTYDGAFRQGVALTALRAANATSRYPAVSRGISWLLRQQCSNGLWASYRSTVTSPCPTADPASFAGPDTNSTGMATQGLAAFGLRPRAGLALKSLHSIQSADAGFPYLAAPGQTSDPSSTALSIQAIIAMGGSPSAPWWRVKGVSPDGALAAYQLGCGDPAAARGAYFFPGDRSANVLSTVQAVPAQAGRTLPLRQSSLRASVPVTRCSGAAPAYVSAAGMLRTQALVAKAGAGTAGKCPGSTGVTVAVDFTSFGAGFSVRCAPGAAATGIAGLQKAGYTVAGTAQYGLALVCRINRRPSSSQQSCATTPPPSAYWAYFHANAGATKWTYSTLGAISYKPKQGSIEGWAFGAGAKPSRTPAQIHAGA